MGNYVPSDRAAQFESITRELSSMQDERERRENTPCCAKCIRGTRALQGPCGRNRACECHTKGTR